MAPTERDAAALRRYWDDIIRGRSDATGLDPALVEAVHRLHELDDTPRADPAFLAKLRGELTMASTMSNVFQPRAVALPLPNGRADRPAPSVSERIDGARRRWWHALEFAAAAAVVVALLGAAYGGVDWLRGANVTTDDGTPSVSLDEAWSTGGLFRIPETNGPPLEIVVRRLTVQPGAEWVIPEGFGYHQAIEVGIIASGPPDEPDHWSRGGPSSGAGGEGPYGFRNDDDKPATVLQIVIGPGASVLELPSGIAVDDLGSFATTDLPGGRLTEYGFSLQVIDWENWPMEDTGYDGLAIIVADTEALDVQVMAGEVEIRRRGADGALGAPERIERDWRRQESPLHLETGDALMIDAGAAYVVEPKEDGATSYIELTIKPNTAGVRQVEELERAAPPTPTPGGTPVVDAPFEAEELPAPDECRVAPRTIEEVRVIAATRPPGTPVIPADRFKPGDGTPADAATVAEIEAMMREVAACYNSGDALRILAMWSDAALGLILDEAFMSEVESGVLGGNLNTPVPKVSDVRLQADGRVTAVVDFDGEVALITFSRVDGRWLLDLFDDQVFVESGAAS